MLRAFRQQCLARSCSVAAHAPEERRGAAGGVGAQWHMRAVLHTHGAIFEMRGDDAMQSLGLRLFGVQRRNPETVHLNQNSLSLGKIKCSKNYS